VFYTVYRVDSRFITEMLESRYRAEGNETREKFLKMVL